MSALGQHSLRVLDPHQVVGADRPLHGSFAQVLVLVLTQSGDGLQIGDNGKVTVKAADIAVEA